MKFSRSKRIRIIRKIFQNPEEKILGQLRDQALVSENYDYLHLDLDLWYVKRNQYPGRLFPHYRCLELDPFLRIFYYTVLQAVIDLRSNRPCDQNLWYYDEPPTEIICNPTTHVCSQEAREFLIRVDYSEEREINITPGTIRLLITKMEQVRSAPF